MARQRKKKKTNQANLTYANYLCVSVTLTWFIYVFLHLVPSHCKHTAAFCVLLISSQQLPGNTVNGNLFSRLIQVKDLFIQFIFLLNISSQSLLKTEQHKQNLTNSKSHLLTHMVHPAVQITLYHASMESCSILDQLVHLPPVLSCCLILKPGDIRIQVLPPRYSGSCISRLVYEFSNKPS